MQIPKINEAFMKSVACTNAHFVYDAEYREKMVVKARDLKDCPDLVAYMEARGYHVPYKGEPNPFTSVIKHQEYGIMLGSSLSYVRMQEKKLGRNGIEDVDYEPKYRAPYKFPIWKELVYLGFDLQTIYFRAYPLADGKIKPAASWTVDGNENTSKYVFAPWADSKDFKLWAHDEILRSSFKDEHGNVLLDENSKEISLRETIDVKFDNCMIMVKGEDIRPKFFKTDEFYSEEELVQMRDAYKLKCETEYKAKYEAWQERERQRLITLMLKDNPNGCYDRMTYAELVKEHKRSLMAID